MGCTWSDTGELESLSDFTPWPIWNFPGVVLYRNVSEVVAGRHILLAISAPSTVYIDQGIDHISRLHKQKNVQVQVQGKA